MIVVLAGEERFREQFYSVAKQIENKYANIFHKVIVTLHPSNLKGELAGKGSNLYHAGYDVKKYVDSQNFDYKKIIVSTFDIDTIFFQAEDGIRDWSVTGVQTCALPI